MQGVKKAAAHMAPVVRGMLFTGFTIQILFGLAWMCRNFGHIQDFGEAESVLYGAILRLCGENPQILYLLQLAAAFWAGYYFLEKLQPSGRGIVGKGRGIWRALVLLSCPFAMQCHLALLPFSFMNSLFLLMLSFVLQAAGRRREAPRIQPAAPASGRGRVAVLLVLAVFCGGLWAVLSGAADTAGREETGRSIEAAMARRLAWPTIWVDHDNWTEDLQEITGEVVWDASLTPGNMEHLEAAIEEKVSPKAARAYYRQIAETGWKAHASMVVRQIGWDVLGYTVTPVIMQIQLRGGAYVSHTGRNYEIMGGRAPILTRNYVDYYSWWFVTMIFLTLMSAALKLSAGEKIRWRSGAVTAVLSLFFCGILVGILVLRGAGIMDYKYTAAVNQLWLVPALMQAWGGGQGRDKCPGEPAAAPLQESVIS